MLLYIIYSVLCIIILLKFFTILTKGRFKANVSLTGKTALVTGGNSGLGYETSLFLASRGCRVIIADVVNASETIEKIIKHTNNAQVLHHHMDLASFSSVRKLAAILLHTERRLDFVICNAGCGGCTSKTEDDIYTVLQVNHLGHFLLIHLLAPLIISTINSRIVFVSSLLAFANNLNKRTDQDINYRVKWRLPLVSEVMDYGNSKMCILAVTSVLARKFAKHNVAVSSCHPGLVKTQIFKRSFEHFDGKQNILMILARICVYIVVAMFGKSPFEGIQSTLHCALAQNLRPGDFIVDCSRFFKPLRIYDPTFCTHIWQQSLRLADVQAEEMLG